MNPNQTITIVFAVSLALVLGHAVRVGIMVFHQRRDANLGRATAPPMARELKPGTGSAKEAAPLNGSAARKVITEAKPASMVKAS